MWVLGEEGGGEFSAAFFTACYIYSNLSQCSDKLYIQLQNIAEINAETFLKRHSF